MEDAHKVLRVLLMARPGCDVTLSASQLALPADWCKESPRLLPEGTSVLGPGPPPPSARPPARPPAGRRRRQRHSTSTGACTCALTHEHAHHHAPSQTRTRELRPILSGEPNFSFFGVFDGHAGRGAAEYVQVHLYHNLVEHPLVTEVGLRSDLEHVRNASVLILPDARRIPSER